MATSIEPQAATQYVDFDEYIDFQLDRTRQSIRWTDVLTAAVGVAALVVGYLLAFVVLDHWVVPGGFGTTARALMLGLLLAGSLGWIGWRVVVPYVRRVNRLYAARVLEESSPEMRSTLLNLVDLRAAGRPISEEIRTSLEKRAALNLSKVNLDEVVDRRPLMRLAYALLAVVVLFCAYSLLSPKKISTSIWRALAPAADLSVATRTEILEVRPGDVEVLARSQLEVVADLRGEVPERVQLFFTTADRKYVDEAIEMRPLEDGVKQFRGMITGENGRGIVQELTYRVEAGDAVSREYAVTVIQPPSAKVESVAYSYPSYMELPPKTEPAGHIDAWEGTKVVVTATANMPVKSALLLFSDTEDTTQRAEELRMEVVDGTKLRAEWTLKFREDGTFPRFYRIACRDEQNRTDPQPLLYNVTIRPDKPPELALIDPTGDLEKPANAIVPLMIVARDPDFQLRFISLRVEKNGEPVGDEEILSELRQSFSATHEFKLAERNLKPGDVVSYWIEARDNKQPDGNRKNTPKLNIRIVEPVSDQEVQRQLSEDKQRQEEKLEEARSEMNEEGMPDSEPMEGEDPPPQGERADEGEQGEKGETGGEPQAEPGEQGEKGRQDEKGETQAGEGEPAESADGGGSKGRPRDEEGPTDQEVLEKLLQRQQRERENQQTGEDASESPQPQDGTDKKQSDKGKKETGEKKSDSGEQNGKKDERQPGDGTQQPKTGDEAGSEKSESNDADGENAGERNPNGSKRDGEGSKASKSDDAEKPGDVAAPREPQDRSDEPQDGGANAEKSDEPEGEKKQEKGAGSKNEKGMESEGGSDEGEADGTPKPGDNPSNKSKSNGGNKKSQPPGDKKSEPMDGDVQNGEERPAEDDPSAEKRKATGDEQGKGTPEHDPDADPTQSKGGVKRKDGADPALRDRQDGEPREPGEKRQADEPPEGEDANARQREGTRETPEGGQAEKRQDPSDGSKSDGSKQKTDGQMKQRPSADEPGAKKSSDPNAKKSDQTGEAGGESESGEPGEEGQPGSEKGGAGEKQSNEGQPGEAPKDGDAQNGEKAAGAKGEKGAGEKGSGEKGGGEKGGGEKGAKGGGESKDGSGEGEGETEGEAGGESKPGKPGQQAGKGSGSGKSGTGSENASGARGGANDSSDGNGTGDGGGAGEGADEANLEDAKKAANLVLKKLQNEIDRGEVDPELLKELGWTDEDMQRFADRLDKQLSQENVEDTSPEGEARRRQFEEMLKSLPVRSGASQRSGAEIERRGPDGGIGPRRLPVPAEYRDAYDAYTRSLSRRTTQPQK